MLLAVILTLICLPGQAQRPATQAVSASGARFAGTWKLNLKRSTLQTAHPPEASTAWIAFDGKTWSYKRTHTYAARKPETWSIQLQVGSPTAHIEKDGSLTFASKIARDGDALVMHEDITASNGQHATNTVRYTLADGGKTLIELEHEQTPSRNELNRWVFDRAGK